MAARSGRFFTKVMLPLAAPGLSAVAITTVLWSWNDLLWPLIVTTREDKNATKRWYCHLSWRALQ